MLILPAFFSAAMLSSRLVVPHAARAMSSAAPQWRRAAPHALAARSRTARLSTAAAAESAPAAFDELDTEGIFDKFELVKTEEVEERGLVAKLYKHKATGAEVMILPLE